MSALESGKPFEDLTDNELAELEARDWSPDEIRRAISLAIKLGEMSSVVSLLHRLAVKDPKSAAAILAIIEAG
jgi:hypothetical protein